MFDSASISQEKIAQMNRAKILTTLRERGVLTKQELAAAAGLSHTTINTYIQALQQDGLVEKVGMGRSVGGRRPTMVSLVRDARCSFGAHISPEMVRILLVNTLGEERDRREFRYDSRRPFSFTLDRIKYTIWDIVKVNYLDFRTMMGVGIAIPGVVDSVGKRVESSLHLMLDDICLNTFQEELGLPIFVENDAVAAAMAERMLGAAKGAPSMAYVSVAEEIGVGIVLDGRIYKGGNHRAGAFGHVQVAERGLACACGRRDCWELYASKWALLHRYRKLLSNGGKNKRPTIKELSAAFSMREGPAVRAVEQYTRFLFQGIENILLAFSPEQVVVGGDLGGLMPFILNFGTEELGLPRHFYGYEDVPIRASAFRENGAVTGAALLPLILQLYQ